MARIPMSRMLLTVACVAFTHASAADPLYIQRPNFIGGNGSQDAQINGLRPYYTAFDDFSLTTGASVRSIEWQGSFSELGHPPITHFAIGLWSDSGGLPGQLLHQYIVPGNARETFVESRGTFAAYVYGADLPVPFLAVANTTYWLSIRPTVVWPPQWFWRDGRDGNDRSAAIILGVSADPHATKGDSAFLLDGSPVPEPSTLLLIGFGATALIRSRNFRVRSHC